MAKSDVLDPLRHFATVDFCTAKGSFAERALWRPIQHVCLLPISAAPGGPGWLLRVGVVLSDYLSAVEIVENVVLRWVPRPVITGMTATAIPEAIRPYSIAVAALSSLKNRIIRRIGNSL
jgi:hypothetical protein